MLQIKFAQSAEILRRDLLDTLASSPLGPLETDLVLMHSNGMRHWIEQGLASDPSIGITAGVRFELPSSFAWSVYRSVLGRGQVPSQLPLDKGPVSMRLLKMLSSLPDTQHYGALHRYLSHGNGDLRKYQLATQIADVFDGYQNYRQDWLEHWETGRNDLPLGSGRQTMPQDQAWQAALWRAVREDIEAPEKNKTRHEIANATLQKLRAAAPKSRLPKRVFVFALSAFPPGMLELLGAMAPHTDIVIYNQVGREVLSPCYGGWNALEVERSQQLFSLAASLSIPIDQLGGGDLPVGSSTLGAVRALLGGIRVQHASKSEMVANIEFCGVHSVQREIECLHDKILDWLNEDATLRCEDILVVAPELSSYLPHIHAVFDRFAVGDARHIPYSVAKTDSSSHPMLEALTLLTQLPDGRLTASQWESMFTTPAFARAFGLSAEDVQEVKDVLDACLIRWGIDAAHRVELGVEPGVARLDQNTWEHGLDQLLLGYACGQGFNWHGVQSQPLVTGLDEKQVSAVLDWLAKIRALRQDLLEPKTPAQWCEVFARVVSTFFKPEGDEEVRATNRFLFPLGEWLSECQEAGFDSLIAPVVATSHWLGQITAQQPNHRFFNGSVQFATLLPLRGLPFKRVCMIGMNDGDFPKQINIKDFDLLPKGHRVGDRAHREDDQLMFLQSVQSAKERLYISWQSKRIQDNAPKPPSVLVAQLMDLMKNEAELDAEVIQLPMQPFSDAYFHPKSALGTYAKEWAPVARGEQKALITAPQPCPTHITMEDLQLLLRQPAEVFMRSRMKVQIDTPRERSPDDEPFDLNALDLYKLGSKAMRAEVPSDSIQASLAHGELPVGPFGEVAKEKILKQLDVLTNRLAFWRNDYPYDCHSTIIDLHIGKWRLTGPSMELMQAADEGAAALIESRYGSVLVGTGKKVQPRGNLAAGLWVKHLMLSACGHQVKSSLCGLDGEITLRPVGQGESLALLQVMLDKYESAWNSLAHAAGAASWAWALADGQGDAAPDEAARKVFEGGFAMPGELERSEFLRRAFDAYSDIKDHIPEWASTLYAPILRHIEPQQNKSKQQ